MLPNAARELVAQLLTKTRQGRVEWHDGIGDAVFVAFPAQSVHLRRLTRFTEDAGGEERGERLITLTLFDERGKELATFAGGPVDKELWELFELATRKAYRVDDVLRDLTKAVAAI
ncbi:MAG: hypothetical protein ACKVVT_03055 [Dehalococcoidia bacterium]